MVRCRECGREVSPNAQACPGCGAPAPSVTEKEAEAQVTVASRLGGRPLFQLAYGRNPITGKARVARAVVAVGQYAVGDLVLAQFGFGRFLAVGQFVVSYGVGIGQFAAAPLCVGMFGVGVWTLALLGVGYWLIGLVGYGIEGGVLLPE